MKVSSWLRVTAFTSAAALGTAWADLQVDIKNVYHPQIQPLYCGPATMEMMLDSPAVRALNPFLPGTPMPDSFQNTLNAIRAPFNFPFGPNAGTTPVAYSITMNLVDNPFHNYAWLGFAPGANNAARASRTLANALGDYQVPGTIVIGHGAHYIDVNGVDATAPVGAGKKYGVEGFRVSDPWDGRFGNAAASLGKNTWLHYYDLGDPFNGLDPRGWFRYFNLINPGPFPWSGQRVEIIEPVGPELPDDGTNDQPLPPPTVLPTELNASQAITDAISDVAGQADVADEAGFENGGFDMNTADTMFFKDSSGQDNVVVTYDGPGGTSDITGWVVIDPYTGTMDEAHWLDNGDTPWTLAQVDQLFENEMSGNIVNDQNLSVPEPGLFWVLGVGLGAITLARRRRNA